MYVCIFGPLYDGPKLPTASKDKNITYKLKISLHLYGPESSSHCSELIFPKNVLSRRHVKLSILSTIVNIIQNKIKLYKQKGQKYNIDFCLIFVGKLMPPSKTKSKMADWNELQRLACVACRLYNVTWQLTTNQIKSLGGWYVRKNKQTHKQTNKMADKRDWSLPQSSAPATVGLMGAIITWSYPYDLKGD